MILRKIVILSLFVLVIFTAGAQNKYNDLWTEVEGLELKGKFQSANLVVDKILKKAKRSNQSDQIVKGFIYKSKFTLLLEEEGKEQIVRELEAAIQELEFPTNVILESVYASFLDQYLDDNNYRIRKRTYVASKNVSDDFKKWDVNTFMRQISKHFEQSLSNPIGLQQLPIQDYLNILSESKTSHKFRPTLFDFLAQRAIDFYEEDRWYVNKPRNEFHLKEPGLFAASDKFVKNISIKTDDYSRKQNVLKWYQALELFHQTNDTTAYVDVILERLNFVRNNHTNRDKDDLYFHALSQLSSAINAHSASASVDYEIADYYYQRSMQVGAKNDKVLKDYRIKALEICKRVIKKYPNSDGGLLCTILKNNIEKKTVTIEAERYNIPQKAFLAKVDFKGIDSLYLSAYKVPYDFIFERYSYKKDSLLLEMIQKNKPVQSSFYKLQAKKDYYQYTTEVDFPGLELGNYLIVASQKKNIQSIQHIYSQEVICVSGMSILDISRSDDLAIKLLDRENGNPLKDVEIIVTSPKRSKQVGKTNANGEFFIKKNENYGYLKILAIHKNDTLLKDNGYISSRSIREKKEKEHIAKMFLYLDRSIYRPGQTVYFKGIFVEKKNGISRVVPNTYTTVVIYDSNYEELKEMRLKTNEFGSISGEFKLPRNLMTGEFTIEMDEDYGTDLIDEDEYYEKIDDIETAEVEFSVEEYKRPKFEVSFDAVSDNYVVGDSVRISGLAKAFLGSSVSNANTKYTVTREVLPIWGRNYYGGSSKIIKTGTTQTDEKGKFSIDFIAIPDSLTEKSNKPIFVYTIKADVTDSNGETRSATQNVHVGYHNLKVDFFLGRKLNSSMSHKVKIETKNLNNQPVDAELEILIQKLKSPDRVVRKKPWEVAELKYIPKEKYIQLFPHEPYDRTDVMQYWKEETVVFSRKFAATNSKDCELPDISDWKAGRYKMKVIAVDEFKDTIIVNRYFQVYHPEDTSLADNQMFEYEIINSNFKQDRFVSLKLKTACQNLKVNLEAYYQGKLVFSELISVENGNARVNVPVAKDYKNKLDFNLYFVKYNSFFQKQFSTSFKEEERELNIETLSFRNKLTPGNKESWSFKIKNSDGKNANAEVLASMYDSSLDQFKSHSWKININFKKNHYYRSPYVNSEFFNTSTFVGFNTNYLNNNVSFLKNYHRLKWFGFNFASSEYSNKRYLERLSSKKYKPKYFKGNISGIVTDNSGSPIPGVSVIIKGTMLGATTDINGFYSIDAPKGSVLVFSFIGFTARDVLIGKSGTYNLAMSEDAVGCDEVVVTAMGIARKDKALSGSVGYVSAKDIRNDLFSKLKGTVAGVEILVVEEEEDEEVSFLKIRGSNSMAAGNSPLYVIDGVPMDAAAGAQFSASEIADISVLKGASATGIYGARARYGVVLISTKKGLEELTQVETRSNLKETAFFFPHVRTNKKGELSFSFDSPQALTKWRLMLFAHNKSVETASLEKWVLTQKNINVIPNAPRFLREDDTITLSVKISNLTKEEATGVAALQLFDAVTMNPIDKERIDFKSTQNFSIAAKGNSSVAWSLKIPKGIAAIQYKIVAKSGKHSDGESSILPVLANRTLVTESRPLWVSAGESKEVLFAKLKKVKSSTQTNHKFSVEYTSNPAWLAIKSLPYLMEFPHECAEQTFSRFYSNALAEVLLEKNPQIKEVINTWMNKESLKSPLEENEDLKSILISETPWVIDLQNDKENKARLAKFFDKEQVRSEQLRTSSKLKELQMSSGGFPWFAGGRENQFITQHIVSGIGHLHKLDVKCENDYKLKDIAKKAVKYLDKEFVKQYQNYCKLSKDSASVALNHQLIHYLYTRSFFKNSHPLSDKVEKVANIYLEKCENSWLTQSLYDKGMIALLMHRNGKLETAQNIIEALSEQAVISDENGMYWKENKKSWYWYQSPIETQALLIEAFTEIDGDLKKVEQLKQWLLKNKQTNKWSSTKATTEAIYALLMNGNECLSVADNTVIKLGDEKISTKKMSGTEKEAGTGYFKLTWKGDEVNSKMATLKVQNKSKIAGFGGAYWQYFEDLDQIESSENKTLSIRKTMYIKETNDEGESLIPMEKSKAIQLGDLITVRLEIESKNDLEFVHLKDLRASGLEPVDVLSKYKWQDGVGYYQSTKDVATHFFFDELPKGTYVFEYEVRANNSGNFSNGISTIQSMYAPEFSSNSKGIRILID